MKKAKLFLTAAAIVVIAGGAFAFNHAKFSKANIYYCSSDPTPVCLLSNYSTVEQGGTPATIPSSPEYFTSGTKNADCSTTVCTNQIDAGTAVYVNP